jgi:hypothetical protein
VLDTEFLKPPKILGDIDDPKFDLNRTEVVTSKHEFIPLQEPIFLEYYLEVGPLINRIYICMLNVA